ncbi:MAG: diguanylate cyclase, partial [Oxalobacter sp.]|nr:diguanylate cyclase [Oxalobacter sp.]
MNLPKSPDRVIAEEIIERSPSVALRVTGENGKWVTTFITENIAAYGYSKDDFLTGKITWTGIVHPDDIDELVTTLDTYEANGVDEYTTVYRVIKADGTPMWVMDNSNVVRNENGEVIYADCIITDYTDTKNNLEKIGDNLRQHAVLNDILQGLHKSDLDKSLQILLDRTGVYLDISRVILFEDSPDHTQCKASYEWCNEDISSMGEFTIDYEKDLPEVADDLKKYGRSIINYGDIPEGSADEFDHEGVIAAAIFAVYIQEEPFGFICFDECIKERQWDKATLVFLENISQLVSTALIRRKNERVIRDMALTDQLTGLGNRNHLEACLTQALEDTRQSGQVSYLLFIDMDDFKIINDGYGHDYGDVILKDFASFLKSDFGSMANVFRFGGDEFVILMSPEHTDSIDAVINSLLARAQLPWHVINKSFYCTLSIGVVHFPEG